MTFPGLKNSDSSLQLEVHKFALALETRLAILLDVKVSNSLLLSTVLMDLKEQTTLSTTPSQRLLFCMLFREIRLLTRSLKPYVRRTILCL